MSEPNYTRAKELASQVLSDRRITEPVVPVFEIAEQMGYAIRFFDPAGKLSRVAGMTEPEKKIIWVNRNDPAYRQSFTVAHELGHICLNHDPRKYGVYENVHLREANTEMTTEEKEANAFAAALLMPPNLLRETMRQYRLTDAHAEILAGIFGVSSEAMRYQLKNMRLGA